jgi:hypothetical protein
MLDPEIQEILDGGGDPTQWYFAEVIPLERELEPGEIAAIQGVKRSQTGKGSDVTTYEANEQLPTFLGWLRESPTGNHLY